VGQGANYVKRYAITKNPGKASETPCEGKDGWWPSLGLRWGQARIGGFPRASSKQKRGCESTSTAAGYLTASD
jgi:hypothetical protein